MCDFILMHRYHSKDNEQQPREWLGTRNSIFIDTDYKMPKEYMQNDGIDDIRANQGLEGEVERVDQHVLLAALGAVGRRTLQGKSDDLCDGSIEVHTKAS